MAPARRPSSPRLPRGRHALDADAAAARYRTLLHAAAVDVVGEQGYGATTVDALAATAGVSTATLYELFSGKEELVLDAGDAIARDITGRLRARPVPEGDLRRALADVLSAVVDAVLQHPGAARLAIVDVVTVGPSGLERRRQLTTELQELLRRAATPQRRPTISEPALAVLAGGTVAVLERHLRTGRLRPLRAAALDLAAWGALYESDAPRAAQGAGTRRWPGAKGTSGAAASGGRGAASANATDTSSPFSLPLPRGRHGLPPAFVKRHQRMRILEAVLAVSAQHGFEATSVRDLIAAAGLSHQTFYQHFASKEDAWSAAFDQAFVELFAAAWYAAAPQRSGADKVTAAVSACLNHLAAEPQRARLLLVDAPSAGRAASPAIDDAIEAFTRLVTRAAGDRGKQSAIVPYALVGGIVSLVAGWVIDDRASELPDLTPALVEIVFVPLFGSTAAREAATGLGAPDPDVAADARRVVMDAFAEAVVRDGFTATRLSDVAQRAGIELDVASALFADELDCATQVLDAWAGQLVVIAAGAFLAAANDPPLAAHRALEAAVGHLARTPAVSAMVVTDGPELVPVIAGLRDRYISLFFQLIAGQVAAIEQRAPQPLAALSVVLDGIFAVLRRFAREGRVTELPAELRALSLQTLTPFFGAAEARRVAELTAAGSPPR
jgi:AcrR family transcriptional regulator